MKQKILFGVFFYLLFPLVNNAQNKKDLEKIRPKKEVIIRGILDENTEFDLPPLSVFMNAVFDNSVVKERVAVIDQERLNYKLLQRDWFDYLSFNGSYAYGYFNSLSREQVTSDSYLQNANNRAQHTFSVGAAIRFSLGDILNRGLKLKKQKLVIEQNEAKLDQIVETRKLKILDAYNSVAEETTVLRSKAESVALYNAEMKIIEKEYLAGRMTIISVALERGRRSGAIVSYQQSRVKLHNAITLLELLTNVRILKNK